MEFIVKSNPSHDYYVVSNSTAKYPSHCNCRKQRLGITPWEV